MFSLYRTPARMEDLALFARHLSGAMATRIPLPEILRAFVRDGENDAMERAVTAVADDIERGERLSMALERHPKIFPASFRHLVRLGEQGRTLQGVMTRLGERLEEGLQTYEHLRRAAAYPLMVCMTLFGVTTYIWSEVSPKMGDIYAQLGSQYMPPFLASQHWEIGLIGLQAVLLAIIIYLLGLLLGLRVWGSGPGRMALSLPVIGPVLRQAETANFANYLALLLENRVPMAEALALMSDASQNKYVRLAIENLQTRYATGERLSDLVESQPLFPASMAVMIASAEDQGALAETLREMGRFYQQRTLHGITLLRELLEPVLLLLAGVFLALTLISIYSPLFSISRMMFPPMSVLN